jgi:ABC-type transport system involved in multi-copper enzyme maturation permease subunit
MRIRDNPVFWLAMRARWRGFRLWWLPLIAAVANLALLGLLLMALRVYPQWLETIRPIEKSLGISVHELAWFYFFSISAALASYAVMFIVPALTATTMSREAEAKTLDMLSATKLPAGAIVWGKFVSGVYPVLIGFAISIAFGLLAFLCGRFPPLIVATTYADYIAALFAVGLTGVALSTLLGRTAPSVVLAYVASLIAIPILQLLASLPGLLLGMSHMLKSLVRSGPFSGLTSPINVYANPWLVVAVALRILASLCIAVGAWHAAVVWIRRRP